MNMFEYVSDVIMNRNIEQLHILCVKYVNM